MIHIPDSSSRESTGGTVSWYTCSFCLLATASLSVTWSDRFCLAIFTRSPIPLGGLPVIPLNLCTVSWSRAIWGEGRGEGEEMGERGREGGEGRAEGERERGEGGRGIGRGRGEGERGEGEEVEVVGDP